MVHILENKFGNLTLYHNHDWHQHDGFINNSKVIRVEQRGKVKANSAIY